jgi:type II secretory pathway component GspD/PulD (secretin)
MGSLGRHDLNTGDWTWGKPTVDEVRLVLDLLEQNGNSKLVSDPHITTIENHEAEIKATTIIPIATINRFTEGAATQDIVTFQDEEVGLSLRVTPRVTGEGYITLDVLPTIEDIIGFSGPSENQKPITSSRSIRTRIVVKDGETAALGGLLKENEITQKNRVPFLGHIPVLGGLLFTNTSKEKTKTDLLILITPRIIP